MEDPARQDVTRVLARLREDDPAASAELLPLVYDELRRLARSRLAQEKAGQTLEPTALVHEAYLRLVGEKDAGWNDRGHFFGAAALAMRRIMVEQARRKKRIKHGGESERVESADSDLAIQEPVEDILALNEALERLEADDPRKGQIVNLRYFGGLSAEETAAAMGISLTTVEREWRYTRAWLFRQLTPQTGP